MRREEDDEDLEISVLIGETVDDLVFNDTNDKSLNKEQSRSVTIIQVQTRDLSISSRIKAFI